MTSAVVLGQGLPLWAIPLALIQNQKLKPFPAGTASLAKPVAGYEPTRTRLRVPPPPTHRELSPPIPKPSASRPANGSDGAGPDISALCRLPNAQPRSQPTPQCRQYQQLRAPAPQTAPFARLTAASEPDADRPSPLSQNQMPVECFKDHRRRIPPPRMQPIRQSAHRVTAIPAQIPPHPYQNPSLAEASDLTAVAAMPLYSYSSAIPRQSPTLCTGSWPKLFNRRRARTSRA